MAERRHVNSIYRTLLLPREHNVNAGSIATFRLRHILAKDGCKESQVALAKSLLTVPSNSPEERAYNAQLAVHWLLQAVQTGDEEAFQLLEYLANSGVGINAVSSAEIEKCLKFTEKEKLSRKVAFSIFRAIMSDSEELIPSDVFKEKVDLIFQEKIPDKKLGDTPPSRIFPEKIPDKRSGDVPPSRIFQEKISDKKLGDIPPSRIFQEKIVDKKPADSPQSLVDDMPLSFSSDILYEKTETKVEETNLRSQKHVSFGDIVNSIQSCLEGKVPLVSIKQVAQYSEKKRWLVTKYFSIFWDLVLRSMEKLFRNLSSLRFSISLILMIVLLEFSTCLYIPGSEMSHLIKKLEFLSVVSLCLLIMLSCTCYVVNINFDGDNLKRWLHLIKFFEPNIRSNQIELKFISKTVSPMLLFILTSIIYIALLPEKKNYCIYNDIGIMSFMLMIFVDRTIIYQRYFVNVSLILNVLTCLYKTNILQNSFSNAMSYLDLKLDYELSNNFYMHISFISCLALPFVLPYLYVKMGLGKRRFWHLVLLPHLMSITWMNLAFIQLSNTTITQNVLSILSLLFMLVLLNYTGFVFTFVLYILINISRITEYLRIEILLFIAGVVILYMISSVLIKKLKISNDSKIWSIAICFTIFILSYQAVKPPSVPVENKSVIPWAKYQTYCYHPAWYRTNTAELQVSCLPLIGKDISLDGTVTSIDIIEVHNNLQLFADILPETLASWFTCSFGENCNSNELTSLGKERCKMYESLNIAHCHLHNWDKYKYQITVEVSSRTSPEVVFVTDNVCSSFVRNLKEGDSIHTVGKLETNIGKSPMLFTLKKARCSSCYSNSECNIDAIQPVISGHSFSLKNIVWFYLSPFIQYRTK